ncbi:unnamed protein product, partial [marine sediment metagenome]
MQFSPILTQIEGVVLSYVNLTTLFGEEPFILDKSFPLYPGSLSPISALSATTSDKAEIFPATGTIKKIDSILQ